MLTGAWGAILETDSTLRTALSTSAFPRSPAGRRGLLRLPRQGREGSHPGGYRVEIAHLGIAQCAPRRRSLSVTALASRRFCWRRLRPQCRRRGPALALGVPYHRGASVRASLCTASFCADRTAMFSASLRRAVFLYLVEQAPSSCSSARRFLLIRCHVVGKPSRKSSTAACRSAALSGTSKVHEYPEQ